MKSIYTPFLIFFFCFFIHSSIVHAQTADEWLEKTAEATATAQTTAEEGHDVETQNPWRTAVAAYYEQAAEHFDKAGNEAQADSDRVKVKYELPKRRRSGSSFWKQ